MSAAPHARRDVELRLHGINACLAAFAHRPDDLRKVWLTEANVPAFRKVLAWCAKHRVGYRIVEDDEIERLTDSGHHEGVCFALLRTESSTLDDALEPIDADAARIAAVAARRRQSAQPRRDPAQRCAFRCERAAALGCAGIVACSVPCVRRWRRGCALRARGRHPCVLRRDCVRAGFKLAATTVRGGESLYAMPLPSRVVLLLGAESTGLPQRLLDSADLRLRIPGTGAVESLNVSVASALLIAEWARVHKVGA